MAVPLQLVLQSARSPVNLRNRMEETTASHATHHPVPAQWARSLFLALLPVLAVFLGGATSKWAEGIIVAFFGAFLIFQPPRRSLGWKINATFLAFALCALVSYLPQSWFFTPDWRTALTNDFGIADPGAANDLDRADPAGGGDRPLRPTSRRESRGCVATIASVARPVRRIACDCRADPEFLPRAPPCSAPAPREWGCRCGSIRILYSCPVLAGRRWRLRRWEP